MTLRFLTWLRSRTYSRMGLASGSPGPLSHCFPAWFRFSSPHSFTKSKRRNDRLLRAVAKGLHLTMGTLEAFFLLISTAKWFTYFVCVLSRFSCVQLRDPMDCGPPGSSVHGILQARILEWVAVPSYRVYILYWNLNLGSRWADIDVLKYTLGR